MKKIIGLVSLAMMLGVCVQAQTAGKTGATKATAAPKLTEKDIMMCDKNWQIVSVEEWGVVTKPPGEKNKTDMLKMTQDGKYELIMFGINHSGTWTKSGQYIYFTDPTNKMKISYKVILVEANKLKVDHFSDEDGHSIFEYEAK